VDALLGIKVPASDSLRFLRQLGLPIVSETSDSCTVATPSFRVDLKREVDLIEEVTRLYGVDRIPATPPRGAIGANACDAVHDAIAQARTILTGLGLHEAQGQTLISHQSVQKSGLDVVFMENPLSSDMDVLRPSLLPGLLDSLRHNLTRKTNDVGLFEIGRTFAQNNGQPREERRIAVAVTGQRSPLFWSGGDRDAKFDAYDLKGIVEAFLEDFGTRGVTYSRCEATTPLFVESAAIVLGKQNLGEMGQLNPVLARAHDLRDPVYLAELNLDLLLSRRSSSKSFKPLPAFPTIRRDVAMLVSEPTTHEQILTVVKQTKPQNLESVELFDVFRGKNVPEGQKSMAYAFTYRSPEKTLTDNEVNAAHEKLLVQLRADLAATIRDS
jgi:phenylalanyl-tRNA synthetase beta chain